jgi:hypothetical protein
MLWKRLICCQIRWIEYAIVLNCASKLTFNLLAKECQQSKQAIFLGDLRKSLSEIRYDAQKRIADYNKELTHIEKNVLLAEKKLSKSKEQFERCIDHKNRCLRDTCDTHT